MKVGEHNHKLTDLLKVFIFSIIMLAPLIAVATKCAYVICNRNAFESYTSTAGTLDNVFYYAVAQLQTESLFNWCTNTGIYTTINAMNTGLGITDATISLLLTYWALLTALYVVFDIIIVLFTKITHFFTNEKD